MTTRKKTKPKTVKAWAIFSGNEMLWRMRSTRRDSITAFLHKWSETWEFWEANGYACRKVTITIADGNV